VGDLLRVARVVQYDFDLSKINGTPVGTLNEYKTPFFELAVSPGEWPEATVATGDRFADGEEIVNFLRKTFGANVCEMELGAIAHVASRAGVKVHSWKAISDVAGNETQADQYKRNLKACLDSLSAKIPALFKAV
jgi:nucleoside phosphorylase